MKKRKISQELFGVACYECVRVKNGVVTYLHAGIVESKEEAERWAIGDDTVVPFRVFSEQEMIDHGFTYSMLAL